MGEAAVLGREIAVWSNTELLWISSFCWPCGVSTLYHTPLTAGLQSPLKADSKINNFLDCPFVQPHGGSISIPLSLLLLFFLVGSDNRLQASNKAHLVHFVHLMLHAYSRQGR